MASRTFTLACRRLVPQTWDITLISSDGTRHSLGSVPIGSNVSVVIPPALVEDSYNVEVRTNGLAWRGLLQKNAGGVTISEDSTQPPVTADFPQLTNFRYDIFEEWLRLKWDGDVSPGMSGLVSAGIWLGSGIPDFTRDPDITVPLFSKDSEHQYVVEEDWGPDLSVLALLWASLFWAQNYWPENYWSIMAPAGTIYAGLAPISKDGTVGVGSYIALPDRFVNVPPSALALE